MTNPSSLAVGREQIGALTQAAAVAEIQGLDASPSFAFIRHGHLAATVFWTPGPDGGYDWRPLIDLVPLFAAEVVAHVASVLTAELDADQSAAFLSGADPRTAADRPESSGALWAFLVTHQGVTEPVSVPLSRADDGTVAFLPPHHHRRVRCPLHRPPLRPPGGPAHPPPLRSPRRHSPRRLGRPRRLQPRSPLRLRPPRRCPRRREPAMTDRAWWAAILVTLVLVAAASAMTAGSTGPARWAVAALLLAAAVVLALLDQAARNRARRRRRFLLCPHLRQRGIYGDEINFRRGSRAQCLDCGVFLPDLPEKQERVPKSADRDRQGHRGI